MEDALAERLKKVMLSEREEKLIHIIIENLSKTAFLSGSQLAKECGVSASFITRMIKKLGYSRFTEFKSELEVIYRQKTTPYEQFSTFVSEGIKKSISKISITQDIHHLLKMQALLDEKVLEKVVDCIERSRTVYLSSMFTSQVGTILLSQYFKHLGIPYEELTGIGLSKRIEYSDIGPNDLLIAISYLRIAREVRDAALYAKKAGAITVAITDSLTNHLGLVCDYVLIAPVSGAVFDYSHVATAAMANLIVNSLAANNTDRSLKSFEKVKEIWNRKPYFCN